MTAKYTSIQLLLTTKSVNLSYSTTVLLDATDQFLALQNKAAVKSVSIKVVNFNMGILL